MNFSDSVTIKANREDVWRFLIDPHRLGTCLPGVDSIEIIEEGRVFGGTATMPLGSNSLEFPVQVEWVDRRPPEGGRLRTSLYFAGYKIEGEGQVELGEADGGGTFLTWHAGAVLPESLRSNALIYQVGLQFASRLIKGFFDCLQSYLGQFDTGSPI